MFRRPFGFNEVWKNAKIGFRKRILNTAKITEYQILNNTGRVKGENYSKDSSLIQRENDTWVFARSDSETLVPNELRVVHLLLNCKKYTNCDAWIKKVPNANWGEMFIFKNYNFQETIENVQVCSV